MEKLSTDAEKIMIERFGKDNIIALATTVDNRPYVRSVNSFYDKGSFYVLTYGRSNKMKQIQQNPLVAIAGDWFTANGKGINLVYFGKKENLDIVNAIASINGVGSRVVGNDVIFRDTPYITINGDIKRNKSGDLTKVSCVSVKTGLILIRQNGKTFIVGNCPGNYLRSKMQYIADEANKINNGSTVVPVPQTNSFLPARGYFKRGDNNANVGKIASFMRKTFPSCTSVKALGNLYGPNLIASIKEFQRRTGLVADGCTGPKTLAKLVEYGFRY